MKRAVARAKVGITIMTLLLVTVFPMLACPVEAAPPANDPYANYVAMDVATKQAGLSYMPAISDDELQEVSAFLSTPPVGTQAYDWYLRAISRNTPTDTQAYMTLAAISENVEVWVQDYRWFLPGDPRNDDQTNIEITPEMAQFVADEFNDVIYPTDTTYFGMPADRDGTNTIFELFGYPAYYWDWVATDNAQRVIIKVLNIRDANYDDPTYPYYTAGFFSEGYDSYYSRNIIHIDCWRWWQRLGAEGTQWLPDKLVNRPYVYDSTITHEYQHLIHADWNPSDPNFMNEGCSMYAELLCGFGIEANYINSYLYTPDNSLIDWGDQGDINILADYGAAALWAVYLSDHYGGAALLRHFVQAGIPGIDGVNEALAYYGYTADFDTVFHDWRIANLIHSNSPGGGKYNYRSLDLNGPDIIPAFTHNVQSSVGWRSGTDFGSTITILGYDTGISMLGAYGSDYIKLTGSKTSNMRFDGDEMAQTGWTWTGDAWFSGTGLSLSDASLLSSAYVDPSDPTLMMETKWGLESFWDFGFVQVSTDGGSTWTSLSNDFTISDYDPSALPAIVDNLPGLTDYNPSWPDYDLISFDLSAYAGTTVLIDFRYMTDWSTTYEGWYIQSASVSGASLSFSTIGPRASFQVTMVSAFQERGGVRYVIYDLTLDSNNAGSKSDNLAQRLYTVLGSNRARLYTVLVVSYTSSAGFADYQFQALQGR